MSDQDLVNLYSGRILSLAASIPRQGRLETPDGSAKRRAPMCGSTITFDVQLKDGRISDFAQEVRACALGQASASLLGNILQGLSRDDLAAGRAAVAQMLESGTLPQGAFAGYEVLIPARDYKNRHGSILLCFDAALAAIDAA